MTAEGKLKETGMRLSEDEKDCKPRRRGKYTPEERDRVRRERNRMHAKRTRDRKKIFLEESENLILKMEGENQQMRRYLRQSGLDLPEELDVAAAHLTRADSESDFSTLSSHFADCGTQSSQTSNPTSCEEALSESSQETREDMVVMMVAPQT
eukprot:scaffold803_cov310-Pinguiococcus_pyrenoidosus.AAC.95